MAQSRLDLCAQLSVWVGLLALCTVASSVRIASTASSPSIPSISSNNSNNSDSLGSSETISRVVGGRTATPFIAKHMAHMYILSSLGGFNFCSGSVISPWHVLTSAHCLNPQGRPGVAATTLFIYVGSVNAATLSQIPVGSYGASRVFLHKLYTVQQRSTADVYYHDVAVIRLDRKIASGEARPIMLSRWRTTPVDRVFACGYGHTQFGGPLSDKLMSVRLKAQPFRTCAAAERTEFKEDLDRSTHLCATSPGFPDVGGKDTCDGDSGSPLYVWRHKRMLQFAITSWASFGCALPNHVAWYTPIAPYREEIMALIESRRTAIWESYP